MKLGFNDTEETFDYAIRIYRCIEFIYKRRRYWMFWRTERYLSLHGSIYSSSDIS